MTIDETIKYYENLAETNKNNIVPKEDYQNMPWIDESNEHYKKMSERYRQLAEWLKELKAYRNMWNKVLEEIDKEFTEVTDDIEHGRNRGLYRAVYIIEKYKKEIELL